MTVIYVKSGSAKGYIRVGVGCDGEKYDFSVSDTDYESAGAPCADCILTEDVFELFSLSDMRYRARLKALRILSYGDNSERMLKVKLSRSGINRKIVEDTVSEMVSLGYINTERQLERQILSLVNIHSLGPGKIIPKLMARGYARCDIESLLDSLAMQVKIDFDSAREALITKKLPPDADGEQVKKLLYKNGY